MNLIRLLLQLIARSEEIDQKNCIILEKQKELILLADHSLNVLHEQQKRLHIIAIDAAYVKIALPLIRQIQSEMGATLELVRDIHAAVIPKPVARIKLLVNHKEISTVQTKQTQKSSLSYVLLDEDGAVTTTASVPQFAGTNLTDFSLEVADDSLSAVLTAVNDVTAECDVTVSVDGKTSNVVDYENTPIVIIPPPPKPVASIVLTGTTPP